MNKEEKKVVRTRSILLNAVRDLTIEVGINNLTILSITRKAGVNRSTFYLHFTNKKEAIDEMTDELLNGFKESMLDGDYIDINQAYEDYYKLNKPYTEATKLFKHIYQFSELYKILVDDQSFQKRIVKVIFTHLEQVAQSKRKDAHLTFITYGIIGLITYWLNNDMEESIESISLELTRATIDFAVKT